MPFYPDADHQCGPASLAGVLNYHGAGVTPEEVSRAVYRKNLKGSLALDLVLYARSRGLSAKWSSGRPDDIIQTVDAGLPLIVMVDYGFAGVSKNHFMVLIGYSPDGVTTSSGKIIDWDNLLRSWEKTKCWNLQIEPQEPGNPRPGS